MIKHWTNEEEQTLINLKNQGIKLADIACVLGRSLEAVRTRSKRVLAQAGGGKNLSWTEEEISLLHKELSYDELESMLGKTRRAIMSKCEKLGISKKFPGTNRSHGTQDFSKPAILYWVDFGEFKKIGVTQVSLKERFIQDKPYKLLDSVVLSLEEALFFEGEILRKMRPFRTVGDVRRGSTECFTCDCTLLEDLL